MSLSTISPRAIPEALRSSGQALQAVPSLQAGIQSGVARAAEERKRRLAETTQEAFEAEVPTGQTRSDILAEALGRGGFASEALAAGEAGSVQRSREATRRQQQQQTEISEANQLLNPILQTGQKLIANKDQTGLDTLFNSAKENLGDSANPLVRKVLDTFSDIRITPEGGEAVSNQVIDENHPLFQKGIVKSTGVFEITTDIATGQLKGIKTQAQNEETQKAVLKAQTGGAKFASKEQQATLPEEAFLRIGKGANEIVMIKKAKQLSTEAAAKLVTSEEGAQGAAALIKLLDDGQITPEDIRLAAVKGVRRLTGRQQQISSILTLLREGPARVLSGAAVPETEQVRFNAIFSIDPLDTEGNIRFKLNRTIRIVDNIKNYVRFGGIINDKGLMDKKSAGELVLKELDFAKPIQPRGAQPIQPTPPGVAPAPAVAQAPEQAAPTQNFTSQEQLIEAVRTGKVTSTTPTTLNGQPVNLVQ